MNELWKAFDELQKSQYTDIDIAGPYYIVFWTQSGIAFPGLDSMDTLAEAVAEAEVALQDPPYDPQDPVETAAVYRQSDDVQVWRRRGNRVWWRR